MKHPSLSDIRNIGIISHIDAGKTTVSERILFYTGEIHKTGEVHEGLATMDWMEQEQERGITITATATSCRWKTWWINLIDTPGHIDFTIEVERSLRVLDGAVAIFSAVEGVQPQSESVWRQADRYRVPRICLINKMDRIGADYQSVLGQMTDILQARPVLLQLPLGAEGEFHGVIDLLTCQTMTFYEADQGATVETSTVPSSLAEKVRSARETIVEIAADFDDSILADFLQGGEISAERLQRALRRGSLECRLFPVVLGAALRNKGIQPLLDAIGTYLPSPLETTPVLALAPTGNQMPQPVIPDPDATLCALAFKVQSDEGRKLTYLRIYAGTLHAGDEVWNSGCQCRERAPRLFRMHAHRREPLEEARAGDIVAAAGLREVLTGDTLCAPDHHLQLAGVNIPEPVVSLAVEPRSVSDRERLIPALDKLQWEDPTFRVRENPETGQTILTGMGELHLEIITDRLKREFGVQVKTGRPQVVYRETLTRQSEHREVFHHDIEGKIQGGEINLRLTPLPRGSGIKLSLPDEAPPLTTEMLVAIRESLMQGCGAGIQTGYPLTDVEIQVTEIPFQPGFTTNQGLCAAARRGFLLAGQEGKPTLLEPVMSLELTVPGEYAGRVIGTLQQKHGKVEGMQVRCEVEVIRARVPLSEMFGYMTELRSATKGRGTYTMEFSHFDLAPAEVRQLFGVV